MAKEVLVGLDIDRGQELLDALDQAGVKVPVALWLKGDDHQDWRLVMGTPVYEKARPANPYFVFAQAVPEKNRLFDDLLVTLKSLKDPLIASLRERFSKTKNVEGMRLGGHSIGGAWIDDAYVYRIK